MKKLFTILFLISLSWSAFSQTISILENGSFEDHIDCPYTDSMPNAIGWSSYGLSPDYFNACDTPNQSPNFDVPTNDWGNQNAADGNAYAGFWAYQSNFPNTREYIGRQLSFPMVIGKKYYVNVKFSLAEFFSNCGINKVGILFSTIPYDYDNPITPNNSPQINTDSIISDTLSWFSISDTIIADSVYNYLVIGNFYTNNQTDTIHLDTATTMIIGWGAYFFVDDCSVTIDSLTAINEYTPTDKNISLNLIGNKKIRIDINEKFHNSYLKIYDIVGRVQYSSSLQNGVNEINCNTLPQGIYIIKIFSAANYFVQKISLVE